MASDYCTTAELKTEQGIEDVDDDNLLATSITVASRAVDGHCGRSFWQDATVVTRELYAESPVCVNLLDQPGEEPAREISTATGLIVKIDSDGDGVFETTLTISTDFLLMPRNAATDGRGFSEILLVDNYNFPRLSSGRAGVQVTAKFGWPSVPTAAKKAALIQAAQLFKLKDAAFGAVALGDSQAMYIRSNLNRGAKAVLDLANLSLPSVG